MAKSSWQYYQWFPRDFLSDRRVRKLDGLVIAILRALQDQLWMTADKQVEDSDKQVASLLDIKEETWLAAKKPALQSGAIYRLSGFIRSPHIDEAWEHCQKISKRNGANKAKLPELQEPK